MKEARAGTRGMFAVAAVTIILLLYFALSNPKPEVEVIMKEAPPVVAGQEPVVKSSRGNLRGLIPLPQETRMLGTKTEVKNGVRRTVENLESALTPGELQLYYTDLLLKDWSIEQDDLTEGVGWTGLFAQIEPKMVRMAIITLVSRLAVNPANAGLTRISIVKVEEV